MEMRRIRLYRCVNFVKGRKYIERTNGGIKSFLVFFKAISVAIIVVDQRKCSICIFFVFDLLGEWEGKNQRKMLATEATIFVYFT